MTKKDLADSLVSSGVVERTNVDLGDDFLQSAIKNQNVKNELFNSEEVFERATILFQQDLFEDAKILLRKILINAPHHIKAQELITEVQKKEIELLLSGQEERKNYARPELEAEKPKAIIEKLERDLNLNIQKLKSKTIPDLFSSEASIDQFKSYILSLLQGVDTKTMLDLGVAFMEMEIYEISSAIFEELSRSESESLVASYLYCESLVKSGKELEAIIRIEPIVRNYFLDEQVKCDFLYVMAIAFENMGDLVKAKKFFKIVSTLNSRYRNVSEKI